MHLVPPTSLCLGVGRPEQGLQQAPLGLPQAMGARAVQGAGATAATATVGLQVGTTAQVPLLVGLPRPPSLASSSSKQHRSRRAVAMAMGGQAQVAKRAQEGREHGNRMHTVARALRQVLMAQAHSLLQQRLHPAAARPQGHHQAVAHPPRVRRLPTLLPSIR